MVWVSVFYSPKWYGRSVNLRYLIYKINLGTIIPIHYAFMLENALNHMMSQVLENALKHVMWERPKSYDNNTKERQKILRKSYDYHMSKSDNPSFLLIIPGTNLSLMSFRIRDYWLNDWISIICHDLHRIFFDTISLNIIDDEERGLKSHLLTKITG